jgi:hypothetical protein
VFPFRYIVVVSSLFLVRYSKFPVRCSLGSRFPCLWSILRLFPVSFKVFYRFPPLYIAVVSSLFLVRYSILFYSLNIVVVSSLFGIL